VTKSGLRGGENREKEGEGGGIKGAVEGDKGASGGRRRVWAGAGGS